MPSPAFQLYVNDFLGSPKVMRMNTTEVGALTLLLLLEWQEVGFEYDEDDLSRWCRLTVPAFKKVWKLVGKCFEEKDGRFFSPRLQQEREKQAAWREKSSKGGKKSAEARTKDAATTLEPPLTPSPNTPLPSSTPLPVTTNNTSTTRVREALLDEPSRTAFDLLISQVPEPHIWAGEIAAVLDGMPGHHHLTPEKLGVAIKDFVAAGKVPNASLRQFRRYLEGIKLEIASPAVVTNEIEQFWAVLKSSNIHYSPSRDAFESDLAKLVGEGVVTDASDFERRLKQCDVRFLQGAPDSVALRHISQRWKVAA